MLERVLSTASGGRPAAVRSALSSERNWLEPSAGIAARALVGTTSETVNATKAPARYGARRFMQCSPELRLADADTTPVGDGQGLFWDRWAIRHPSCWLSCVGRPVWQWSSAYCPGKRFPMSWPEIQ